MPGSAISFYCLLVLSAFPNSSYHKMTDCGHIGESFKELNYIKVDFNLINSTKSIITAGNISGFK